MPTSLLRQMRSSTALALGVAFAVGTAPGCASVASSVEVEAGQWGAFHLVQGGELGAGQTVLPAPLNEGYCYRVIIAVPGQSVPSLRYQGEIDAQSVGFPLRAIDRRSAPSGSETTAVYGFCTQGTGTIQLVADLPVAGYGALYEAPFSSLDPSHGQDVVDARAWLAEREGRLAERRAREEAERRAAAVAQFADSIRPELSGRVDALVELRGRYRDVVFDEVRSGVDTSESLVLEPGRCYLFAVVPHGATTVEVDVRFSRIRNAAERNDEGGITYSVCTAPSGPVQEVTLVVNATVPAGSTVPPAYAARVAHRVESSAERRAADAEWVRMDPEARIE